MELNKRSRVWIVTFHHKGDISDDQLPDHCGEFVHAITSEEYGSCSVFMKFKTLRSASSIQSLFCDYDQLVIKRYSWDKYEEFKETPFSSQVLRYGPKKHDDSDKDQPLDGQQYNGHTGTNDSNDQDGYETDDMVADVQRSKSLKRQLEDLSSQLSIVKKRIVSYVADQLD